MLASLSSAEIVSDVRGALSANDFALADALIGKYKAERGVTPEMLDALSWTARGALAAKQLDKADRAAHETRRLAADLVKTRGVDSDPHLAIAVGAAIEVEAQVLAARGERGAALELLRRELAAYGATSLHARIQKNINLIDLVGKPAPALDEHEFLGPKPPTLAALRGKPVLLFFWAHWCGDCKLERKDISQIRREFASQGLTVLMPTQRYGYTARGEDATPEQELQYIDRIRNKYYLDLIDVPAPVSKENGKLYGTSTTPTLVLIDRHGVVKMFHPGRMPLAELEQAVRAVL